MSTNEEGREGGNGERLWLTGEEFKARIEAHDVACRQKARLPKMPDEPRRVARELVLDFNLKYTPKRKSAGGMDLEVKP